MMWQSGLKINLIPRQYSSGVVWEKQGNMIMLVLSWTFCFSSRLIVFVFLNFMLLIGKVDL